MERKVKYNYEFKLRCVEEVLKDHHSINSVAITNDIGKTSLGKWISFYQKYGNAGLLSRKNQNYSPDFKFKVLQAVEEESLSLAEACLKFNISSMSVINNWQRKYSKENILGLENKPKGRPKSMKFKRAAKKSNKPLTREEELLLEIESLKCENELLKKFNALIQPKKLQAPKKPRP